MMDLKQSDYFSVASRKGTVSSKLNMAGDEAALASKTEAAQSVATDKPSEQAQGDESPTKSDTGSAENELEVSFANTTQADIDVDDDDSASIEQLVGSPTPGLSLILKFSPK
jgi:hypothetical protein